MNVYSLSLSLLHLLPLCRTCGITGTRTTLTWLEPNTASNVKRPNISRALTWRQWKSVTCSAVCVSVHTTCDNQSCPILPGYATCHRQMVYCASDLWTLTRQYDWLPAVVTGMSLSAKPWTENHRPRYRRTVERKDAPFRGQKRARKPLKTSEDQRATFSKDTRCVAELWTTTS